jgi:hypothetical protein
MLSKFNSPRLRGVCPGKGTLLVTKQFALQESSRDRRAAYLDKLAPCISRVVMNPPRHRLLARSPIAAKQHGCIDLANLCRE